MKRFLLWGLLLAGSLPGRAQVTQLPDLSVYRGADYSVSVSLPKADSSYSSAAMLYFGQNGSTVKPPLQPIIQRLGRTLTLTWSASQTGEIVDGKYWLEIKSGSSIRFAAWVFANKNPTTITPPGTISIVSPPDLRAVYQDAYADLWSQLSIYLF